MNARTSPPSLRSWNSRLAALKDERGRTSGDKDERDKDERGHSEIVGCGSAAPAASTLGNGCPNCDGGGGGDPLARRVNYPYYVSKIENHPLEFGFEPEIGFRHPCAFQLKTRFVCKAVLRVQ